MSVPRNPSFSELNRRVNQGIDGLQRSIGWQPDYGRDNSRAEIDGLWSSIRAIEARVGRNEVTNKLEHAKLWGAIRGIENLVRGALAGLPALVKFLVLSSLSSVLFSMVANIVAQLIGRTDLGAVKKIAEDALSIATKALGDARAAATIAVKAEGKADRAITLAQNAINELKAITQDALRAMQRLEAFIKSEIAFLTNSTLNALTRLQGRIARLEGLVTALDRKLQVELEQLNTNLTAQINAIKTDLERRIQTFNTTLNNIKNELEQLSTNLTSRINAIKVELEQLSTNLTAQINAIKSDLEQRLRTFNATINNIKNDVFKELAKLKPLVNQIPKILADIAAFTIQVAAVTLAISGIQAALRRLNPVTIINNYNTTNVSNTTNVINAPPDLALLRRIDVTTRTNLGVSYYIQQIATTVNLKMGAQVVGGLSGNLGRITKFIRGERITNFITMAATLHNAAMLSNALTTTLLSTVTNVFSIIGLRDADGEEYDASELIKTSLASFLKSVVGATNYDKMTLTWKKASRVYQTGANVVSRVRSIVDSVGNIASVTHVNVADIGNALRRDGVVDENSYSPMARNPGTSRFQKAVDKVSNLTEAASDIESVTSSVRSIQDDVREIRGEQAEFNKAIAAGMKNQAKAEVKLDRETNPPRIDEKDLRRV